MEQTLVKGFSQRFLFGQPEADHGANTGKECTQRFLSGQPEVSNGTDTGKGILTAIPLRTA